MLKPLKPNAFNELCTEFRPALVAESDACSTGDQNVLGLIPVGSGNILS